MNIYSTSELTEENFKFLFHGFLLGTAPAPAEGAPAEEAPAPAPAPAEEAPAS